MIKTLIRRFWRNEDGTAAVEAAVIFPVLLTMLLSTFDLGNGILTNQKVIRASQVAADLVTRTEEVTDTDIDEAIMASGLALTPFSTASYGIDIVSISFDASANPQIVWRETRNMAPNPDVLTDVLPLAEAGNGVVMVTVQYLFTPRFADFVVGNVTMSERAFARGRRSAVVSRI